MYKNELVSDWTKDTKPWEKCGVVRKPNDRETSKKLNFKQTTEGISLWLHKSKAVRNDQANDQRNRIVTKKSDSFEMTVQNNKIQKKDQNTYRRLKWFFLLEVGNNFRFVQKTRWQQKMTRKKSSKKNMNNAQRQRNCWHSNFDNHKQVYQNLWKYNFLRS